MTIFDEYFGMSRREILQQWSSQLCGVFSGGEIEVDREGRRYHIFIYEGHGVGSRVGTPAFFEVKTSVPSTWPQLVVRKAGIVDWIAHHVFLMDDFHIGDADFDSKFSIKINDKQWGASFFTDEVIRSSISALLSGGFDLLRSEEEVVKVIKLGTSYPSIEMINMAMDEMDRLIREFESNN